MTWTFKKSDAPLPSGRMPPVRREERLEAALSDLVAAVEHHEKVTSFSSHGPVPVCGEIQAAQRNLGVALIAARKVLQ